MVENDCECEHCGHQFMAPPVAGHRLLCGDSTKTADVDRLMGGAQLDLVFSDPPYNVAYSGLGQNKLGTIKNDDQDEAAFAAWIDAALSAFARAMKPQAAIYICHPDSASAPKLAFETSFAKHFHKSATIIWVKQSAGMGWQDYRAQHEPILYGWKQGKKGAHFFVDRRDKTTLWQMSRDAQINYVHPTQKPVALSVEAIRNSSKAGWKVGDFFCGSGSTIVACEAEKRVCFAMDMDPRFVDVSALRWQDFVKQKATLAGDGRTFDEIAKARAGRTHGAAKPAQVRPARGGNGLLADGVAAAPDAGRNAARAMEPAHERAKPVRVRKGAAGPGQKGHRKPVSAPKAKGGPTEPPQA